METPPISTQALPSGTRIEEFIIEKVLGSGGFGITYLARDISLNRQVVIKENLPVQFAWRDPASGTVRPRHTTGGDADDFAWSMNNFIKEAETLASLDHPGIVRVLRKFETNGTAYFVMPFVEGIAFDELIDSRNEKEQVFSEEEIKGLLDRMLNALAYLHDRGIYHRDIKPGNILISNDGVPALIDFGSARQQLSERSMTVVESAGYTPFEQLQSRGNVGPWSDLYALGATLVKAITLHAPPKAADRIGDDPMATLASRNVLVDKYSPVLLYTIDRALAVNVKERWQCADEWRDALVSGNALIQTQKISTMSSKALKQSGQGVQIDKSTTRKPAKFIDNPDDALGRASKHLTMVQSSAQGGGYAMVTNDSKWSAIGGVLHRRIFVTFAVSLVVLGLVIWMVNRRASGNGSNTVKSGHEISDSSSPFLAANVAPSTWLKMAEAGDPLAQALLGDALFWGGQIKCGIKINQAEGFKWIEKSANAGHPLGHSLMGLLRMSSGKWVPQDESAAKEEFVEALRLGLLRDAEKGGPVWWTSVAQTLEIGKGISADPTAAVSWYRKAAETGYVDAINQLGNCYRNGHGVTKDEAEALKWYRKSAEVGSADGMMVLGRCLQYGIGASKDEQEAAQWYMKAAEQGYTMAQVELGDCYANGSGLDKNPVEAVKWFRKATDQGCAEALVRMGDAFSEGEGVPKDLAEAIRWYQKAADQGHAEGQLMLGMAYEFGDGVTENAKMAAKWYKKAAEQGNAEGQSNLGDCYRHGEGVPEDPAEAVKWYRISAEQGNASAQNGLGSCYANGVGVTKDPVEAASWYLKSANQGFAIAQTNIGYCYSTSEGVNKDPFEAVKWYRKAAEKEYALAQFLLGGCYNSGEGVAKDSSKATKWYRKAAEKGLVAAQYQLGVCYLNGEGVAKDLVDAVKWYQKAAEQGHIEAQFNLGICYERGSGVSKDPVNTAKWYERAAQQGHYIAQNNLGICYADGLGVPKNLVLSYMWIDLAIASGNEQIKKNLESIYYQMTSVQITEAKRLGREWKPKKESANPIVAP